MLEKRSNWRRSPSLRAGRAVLGEAGMQEDRVRHDRRADDADGDRQGAGVGQLRRDATEARRAPIDRRDEHLGEIAKRDGGDQGADDEFDRAKPASFEHQDAVGQHGGDAHAGEQRDMQQQRKANGAAEEFGKVGRHRRHFADDPQRVDDGLRKMLAAHFGQIAPGHDAELGRQRLEQHGDDIGQQHDPQQRIAVFRAGLDVGGEIAGVHIGDRGDHRRPGEQQRAEPARLAGQHVADRLRRSDPSFPSAPQRRSLVLAHVSACSNASAAII